MIIEVEYELSNLYVLTYDVVRFCKIDENTWELHREDGPAIIFHDGIMYNYRNGARHYK